MWGYKNYNELITVTTHETNHIIDYSIFYKNKHVSKFDKNLVEINLKRPTEYYASFREINTYMLTSKFVTEINAKYNKFWY